MDKLNLGVLLVIPLAAYLVWKKKLSRKMGIYLIGGAIGFLAYRQWHKNG